MVTYYVTYGFGSRLANCYSAVKGEDIEDVYRQINGTTRGHYAFCYGETEFDGQIEQYGLTEVPLQAASGFEK